MAKRYPTTPQVTDPIESRETITAPLGEIQEVPLNVPSYVMCHTSIVAARKLGKAPGQLFLPSGVAVHERTHQIIVANSSNDRVEIFSETGEFISHLGVRELSHPYGIAIRGDSVYISCLGDHTVSKYSLTGMCLVRRIGGEGSDNGQFDLPRQLTTDPIGRVFIADSWNDRICIHDPDLNHLRNIVLQFMSKPFDVKASRDRLFVLCPHDNPCMHVLTLRGDKLHSLITCGRGKDVLEPWFFCFDSLNNFVLSDNGSDSLCVFSSDGILLHTMGQVGDQQGLFHYPYGVAITPNGRLVFTSWNRNYGLQIFY